MKIKEIIYSTIVGCLLVGCAEENEVITSENQEFTLQAEVMPFEGEGMTRAYSRMDGDRFDVGDWIRLKVICPFVTSTEHSETTYSGSYDGFFLLKKGESGWGPLTSSDKCDINGDYYYSGSPFPANGGSYTQAQQTPHIYMASTWTEEKSFRVPTSVPKDGEEGGTGLALQFCHVFHADQREDADYKASDLLWAQQYMQTCAWNVKMEFHHVMCRLVINIDDSKLPTEEKIKDGDVLTLTLEGMPDIDQQEVIVGDYYAQKSKVNTGSYCYRNKNSCNYEYNGKVIGIGVNVETALRAYTYPMTGNPNPAYNRTYSNTEYIKNTGTYTANKRDQKEFWLIVPPCKLDAIIADGKTSDDYKAKFWLRNGEKRYVMTLDRTEFVQGTSYEVTMTLKSSDTPDSGSDNNPDTTPDNNE